MECSQVESNIQLYVDQELSGEALEQLKQHLTLCPECERYYQRELMLKQTVKEKIFHKCIEPQLIEDVRHHVLGAIA